jgi:hypothetical protein
MAAAVLMMKAQVGLGVLSLPATFHTLGLIPGLIVLVVIAVLWTCEWHFLFPRDVCSRVRVRVTRAQHRNSFNCRRSV